MFELVSADRRRSPHRGSIPILMSTTVHLIAVSVLVAVPFVYVSSELPQVPDMLTFVVSAAPPPPPLPPPPPPAAAPAEAPTPKTVKPVRAVSRPAPIAAPVGIAKETEILDVEGDEGVPGGIEGGVPGGVIGGVIGGLIPAGIPPPPPPPPTPVVEREPVRVGGAITAPALVERVEPEYPPVAVSARVQGVVILEATVGRDGRVEDVRILRSLPLLDRAAMNAVRRWRYSPLLLNGTPERFVVTVTVSFSLGEAATRR
jgi:protein TonB